MDNADRPKLNCRDCAYAKHLLEDKCPYPLTREARLSGKSTIYWWGPCPFPERPNQQGATTQ